MIKFLITIILVLSYSLDYIRAAPRSHKVTLEIINSQNKRTIKVICTAALIADNYESRKKQYSRSLSLLKDYGYDTYVVESCQRGPTFLDLYCNNVCYTQSNNCSHSNKGANEALSLLIGLKYFNFAPNDMMVKLTGRYPLESDEFIRLIEKNLDADALVRAWNDNDVYTGLFAIRLKYFLDFLEHLDIEYMAGQSIALEHAFGAYITKMRDEGAKIVYLERVYDYLPICTAHRH